MIFFRAPAAGGLFIKGPSRRACPIVVCGQGGCLSPLLRGWWPEVVVAPPELELELELLSAVWGAAHKSASLVAPPVHVHVLEFLSELCLGRNALTQGAIYL